MRKSMQRRSHCNQSKANFVGDLYLRQNQHSAEKYNA